MRTRNFLLCYLFIFDEVKNELPVCLSILKASMLPDQTQGCSRGEWSEYVEAGRGPLLELCMLRSKPSYSDRER